MKEKAKLLTIAFTVLFLLAMFLPQQSMAQKSNQSQIVEKIINLPDLQQFYPVVPGDNAKQVTIVQFPVAVPSDIAAPGKTIVLTDRENLQRSPSNGYFMFRSIEVNQNTAKVVGHYFYNYNSANKKSEIIAITADLQKTGSQWNIVNSNVKGVE